LAAKDWTNNCAEGGKGDEEDLSHQRSYEQEGNRKQVVMMLVLAVC
jgi:hypothetical protein